MRVVAFVGASISGGEAAALCPGIDIRPPVARGDIYNEREAGADVLVIIDGLFAQNLAVPPREIVDVLASGAVVYGAASMGALRSADCHPAGMMGIGLIARLYRAGVLESDDEVAVALDPFADFAAATVPLINLRVALRRTCRAEIVERAEATRILDRAIGRHYTDRTWDALLGAERRRTTLRAALEKHDVKRDDAAAALRTVSRAIETGCLTARVKPLERGHRFAPPVRYPGHNPTYGHTEPAWRRILLEWLIGSGRYQRYVWPILYSESAQADIDVPLSDASLPARRREAFVRALGRLLADEDAAAALLWQELSFLDEAEAEGARCYAHLALGTTAPSALMVRGVREEVAIRHGLTGWDHLVENVDDGRLFGVIPLRWIEHSVDLIGAARTNA